MSRLPLLAVIAASVATGLLAQAPGARADSGPSASDESNQPYIDQIQKSLPPVENSEGYVESIKGKLAPDNSTGYTEKLKQSPALNSPGTSSEGYTDQVKEKLAPKTEGGAIEAVKEGHSELKMTKSLDITQAIGFRYGVGMARSFAANTIGTGQTFNNVYGAKYAPDMSLFYERQLYHDEIYGSFGLFGMGEIAYYSGNGAFATTIASAINGSSLNTSLVNFRFFEIPVTAGGVYRFNLMKYVRPYVMGGPTVIGFTEGRNDGGPTHNGISHGIWAAGGVSILMDWVSRSQDWDRYDDDSIKHTYFTVEYSKLSTFSSPVDFSTAGPYAGLLFEF